MKTTKKKQKTQKTQKTKQQTTKKKQTKKQQTKTYIIKSAYLKPTKVKGILSNKTSKNIIWEEYNKDKHGNNPDWIHTDEKFTYDKSLWKYKSTLKSTVDLEDKAVTNKYNLVASLKHLGNKNLDKMLMEQYKINLYDLYKTSKNKKSKHKTSKKSASTSANTSLSKYKHLFDNNRVWIFKPIYGHEGKDILIFKTFDDFYRTVTNKINNSSNRQRWKHLNYKKYKKMRNLAKFALNLEWVLQEYITNPLLYKDKKFHLRGYYLFHRESPTKKTGYLFDNHRIFTASEPYINGDYLNKKIHDTHIGSTPSEINYNPDIKHTLTKQQRDSIDKQLDILFKNILKVINSKCYPENKYCYHIFASDIMITDTYHIKLIELNTRPGMGEYSKQKVDYPHLVFETVVDKVVNHHF